MMKSALVVKASLSYVSGLVRWAGRGGGRDLPADSVFLHLPVCGLLAVEDVVGVGNVSL